MKRAILFSLLISILTLSSCCDCRKSRKLVRPLVGTEWRLVQIMAHDVVAEGDSFTLQFHDNGTMTGVGDCNRLSATFTTNADRVLQIENIGSTRRLCPNQEAENQFVDMLDGVTHYEMDATYMLMLSNGTLVAIFEAVPVQ